VSALDSASFNNFGSLENCHRKLSIRHIRQQQLIFTAFALQHTASQADSWLVHCQAFHVVRSAPISVNSEVPYRNTVKFFAPPLFKANEMM
jgi:hypothetical protein